MSMREANKLRTLCEVIRECNDICEEIKGNPKVTHQIVRIQTKLAEAEKMGGRMAKKLYEYNKEFDKGWWEKNQNYEEALRKRMGYAGK